MALGLIETKAADAATPDPGFAGEAFGLRWLSNRPLAALAPAAEDGRPADILIEQVDTLHPRLGGRSINRGTLYGDGTRFAFDGAVIDMFDGERIHWCHPTSTAVPHALYGTVTSHLLAWRGLIPLHASAIAFGEEAILIGGCSGAGKSTLARALIDAGGLLVSDDLSAMLPMTPGGVPMLLPGRSAIRLAVDGAGGLSKRLDHPRRVAPDRLVRAAMLLLLRDSDVGSAPAERGAALAAQLFRPRWMRALPHARQRAESLLHAAQRMAMATLPPATRASAVSPARRAEAALALLDRMRVAA